MFDWDKDAERLLTPAARAETRMAEPEGRADWHRKLLMWAFGALVALAFAYEKDVLPQMRMQAHLGFEFLQSQPFVAQERSRATAQVPQGLAVYDTARAQDFLDGLRAADQAALQAYLARTHDDLTRADPALAPFLRDVVTLLNAELAHRAVNAS